MKLFYAHFCMEKNYIMYFIFWNIDRDQKDRYEKNKNNDY